MKDPVCKNCKYRQLCRECPVDFSCSDVKKLAELDEKPTVKKGLVTNDRA